ncbi:hypothetical protein [Salirhabdus salicampi]|uniref:hypothetical protein n=1 Tax=Salirhabdus salicampi TaxID=476102 RepID=UPI0020C1FCF9|nr:hypothetical protein [Salirhabdus salicampi]MCP8615461.1 hypothetical protein [Salirhabdus salicampi]
MTKKQFFISVGIILSTALAGCGTNDNNLANASEGNSPEANQVVNEEENDLFTKEDAVASTIVYHNASNEVKSNFDFPTTIKPEEQFSQEIEIGGKQGNTTQLEMAVNVEGENGSYIVTLTEDYNITVNETMATSYWKYEVSKNSVKLLEKKEEGNIVKIIK